VRLHPNHAQRLTELGQRLLTLVLVGPPKAHELTPLLAEFVDLLQTVQGWNADREEDLFAAEIAAHLLPWDSAGDEAAAVLAVHTAKLLIKHAGQDQHVLNVEGGGGKPS